MLKKIKTVILFSAMIPLLFTSSLFAGGSIDSGLNISIPCVNVAGSFFDIQLLKFDHPSDPGGLYWNLGPTINATTDDGDCAQFDTTTFGLTLPNLDVLGTPYDVTLSKFDCPQYPNDLIYTLTGGTPSGGGSGGTFTLSTTSFTAGDEIPLTHVCDSYNGSDISPELSWSNAPSGTNSYALVMDDEVSPCGTGDNACQHWSVYNIPVSESGLAQGVAVSGITGATEGENYTGGTGYAGPCPPNQHTYTFTVYALASGMPTIPAGIGMTRSMFASTYASYILGSATITGIFTP